MKKVAEGHWIKPEEGYLLPDPKCPECGGKGSIPSKITMGDGAEAVWCGVCPICGEYNGVHFQYPGAPPPTDDDYPPPCVNYDCPNEHCTWVREEDLEDGFDG